MIQLTINGKTTQFDGDPEMPLLWYLRDGLDLKGTSLAVVWSCAARAQST